MIKFRCPKCSVNLTAVQERAGSLSKCPKCKSEIIIPQLPPEPSIVKKKVANLAIEQPKLLDKKMFDLPEKQNPSKGSTDLRQQEKELLESLGLQPAQQYTGERKFPWPIDILLYPCSVPGLTNLAIIIGVPLALSIIQRFAGFPGAILAIPLLLVNILVGVYAGWYLAECVQDSTKGGTRAPEVFAATEGFSGMWSRVLYLAAVYILFVLPAVLYPMYTNRTDVIFWVLVAWGIIFFPMGLLAMVMFDSTYALNPLFLLGSIFRVFFQYVGLLILFGIFAGLVWLVPRGATDKAPPIWLEIIGVLTCGYGAFIVAHVLGRFYWRNRDKLDWGF